MMTGRPIVYPGQQIVNGLLAFLALAGLVLVALNLLTIPAYIVALVSAAILGVLFVLPIGGADMPVIISLLNSFTGLAAALTGFALGNNVLIISGALVGASGTLLNADDGQSDESLRRERPLRSVRRRAESRRRRVPRAPLPTSPCASRRSTTSRRCSPTRVRSSSFPVTGWPSRKRNTAFANSRINSRKKASK